jgi:hypothetical protein
MPFLVLIIIGFVINAIYARRNAGTRNCRWREDRKGSKGALIKYNCVTCGVEAFRSSGKPDRCLSNLKTTDL